MALATSFEKFSLQNCYSAINFDAVELRHKRYSLSLDVTSTYITVSCWVIDYLCIKIADAFAILSDVWYKLTSQHYLWCSQPKLCPHEMSFYQKTPSSTRAPTERLNKLPSHLRLALDCCPNLFGSDLDKLRECLGRPKKSKHQIVKYGGSSYCTMAQGTMRLSATKMIGLPRRMKPCRYNNTLETSRMLKR